MDVQGRRPCSLANRRCEDRNVLKSIDRDVVPEPLQHLRHRLNGDDAARGPDLLGRKGRKDSAVGPNVDERITLLELAHNAHQTHSWGVKATNEYVSLGGVVAEMAPQLDAVLLDVVTDAHHGAPRQLAQLPPQNARANRPRCGRLEPTWVFHSTKTSFHPTQATFPDPSPRSHGHRDGVSSEVTRTGR